MYIKHTFKKATTYTLFCKIMVLVGVLFCSKLIAAPLHYNPGTVYLFAYTTGEDHSRNGLYFAWSTDKVNWHTIGPEHGFLQSDYGAWGAEKKMVAPYLFQDAEKVWHCIWSVNTKDHVFAHAASTDLINWKRQSYPEIDTDYNILQPSVWGNGGTYTIAFKSNTPQGDKFFSVTTNNFKTYTNVTTQNKVQNGRTTITISGKSLQGTLHNVNWSVVKTLIDANDIATYKNQLYSQTTKQDADRFKGIEELTATIQVNGNSSKAISPLLIGIFFEDINYAADGGLYAELLQNRDFEYSLSDRNYQDANWNYFTAWQVEKGTYAIDSTAPIHINNKHYVVFTPESAEAKLVNTGYNGIALTAGEKYNFSVFANTFGGANKLLVSLTDVNGKVYGSTTVRVSGSNWKKYTAVIKVKETIANAQLVITPSVTQKIAVDMVSLFPQKTFKGHKNGLRADLAQTIADLHPKFVRFPGGCVAHGNGLDNIYRWKNTIGPLEARKQQRNIWNYHQSMGLGYFEYFQFCEDLNAEPLPVIAAGVPCQNSSIGGAGQQCGIPMEEMDTYIKDILDLIEWANGDTTTEWGKKRAEAGHPKPFNLKYIGIGNEDLITDVFEERFTLIFNAIKEKHPEITVIGTVGPFYEGTDYEEGWELANRLEVPMVDEHYYVPPGWLIHNQDFYDAYDRNNAKVYLGEYASHLPGRPSNMETALSEALYLTAVERNADVVSMTSYAPLLAKEHNTQWTPDLIYFNNTEVKPTTDYYVQKLYGQNAGTIYYNSTTTLSSTNKEVNNRVGVSVVKDEVTNELIIKLVNMLPVPVRGTLNLTDFSLDTTGIVYIFKGNPEDDKVQPVQKSIDIKPTQAYVLDAYSFSVIRIKLTE